MGGTYLNKLSKYKAAFSLGLQRSMEYRTDFMLSILSAVFPIIIQVFLWTAVYGSTNRSSVYGYTYIQMLIYTLLAGLISKLVATGFEHEINEDIKNGGLNKYIIKPVNYFIYRLCCFIGSKAFSLLILGLIISGCIGKFYSSHQYSINTGTMALFSLSLMGAILLNFLIYFCISMMAFWISEAGRLFGTINIILVVLSGGIFPIDIFGSTIKFLLNTLPFMYTIQFPVDVICGRLALTEAVHGLAVQFAWIFALLVISLYVWRNGLKKYIAVGG